MFNLAVGNKVYLTSIPRDLCHTVGFEVFRSLSDYEFATFYFDEYLFAKIFVKSQHSLIVFHYLTGFYQHYLIIKAKITAIYGDNLRGSVFRIVFRTFLREFESVETSPGFAQFLGEKFDFQNYVGKKSR